MFSVVVQPLVQNGHVLPRHLEKTEHQRAEHGQRHGPQQDDERVAEAVELRGQHEKDQNQRQREGGQEFVALGAQLAGFAGVIQLVTFRQDFARRRFQGFQRLVQRADGHAAEGDGVELLKAVERARRGFLLQRREGAHRHQLPVRPLHIIVLQLAGIQALDAFELRNDLVAAAGKVEAVDVIAADQRRQVRAHRRHVQPQRGHLVAVQHQLHLRLVNLRVNHRRERKHAVGRGLLLQLLRRTAESAPARRWRR